MDRDFEKAIMDMDGLVDPVYLPETALKIGVYFWRWTLGEVESEVFEFEVPEDAVVLEVPSVDTWLQSLPDGHPRLYLLPEDLKNFRESNGGDRSDMREMLLESATGLLDTPHQMDEQTCSPGDRRDT
jgi:hypothetical protein